MPWLNDSKYLDSDLRPIMSWPKGKRQYPNWLKLMPERLMEVRTPSLCEEIQHGCLICLGSEQPSSFSCLIILGHNFPNLCATAQNVWSGYKENVEFHVIFQYYGVRSWDMNIFLIRQTKNMCDLWIWKPVSTQAAYYMEWRGPLEVLAKRHTFQLWLNYVTQVRLILSDHVLEKQTWSLKRGD